MKKLLLILMLLLCNIMVVNASSFNTYLIGPSTISHDSTFSITVGVKNAKDLYGLSAIIEYDHNILELVESSGLNGFNVTCGNSKIILDSASSKSGNFSLANIKFIANSTFSVGDSTIITLKSIEGGNGDELFNGVDSSIKITAGDRLDSNNKLKTLIIENYDIDFDPNINVYYLRVINQTEKITISALSDSKTAKVQGIGTFPLNIYDNNFQITVIAENGVKNIYQLIVSRADENGKYSLLNSPLLNALSIDGYDIDFKSNIFNYSIEIADTVEDLNVFAFSQMEDCIVEIDKPEKFIIGENVVKIHVTDKNGNESIYTIDVFKKEAISNNMNNDKETSNSMINTIILLLNIFIIGFLIGYFFCKKKNKT